MLKKHNLARSLRRTSRAHAVIFFYSIKTGRFHLCESWPEYYRCLLLEFDADVLSYETQPFSIRIPLARRETKYTPDALVALVNNRFRLEEVKPTAAIDVGVQEKIDALRAVLDPAQFDIELVDAGDYMGSALIENLELIYRYMRHPPSFDAAQLSAVGAQLPAQKCTLGRVARLLQKRLQLGAAEVWWLVGSGLLRTDIYKPITLESLVEWRVTV